MAPALDVARGSPHDSICMTVAARFGSTCAAADHWTMFSPQYWTSSVKTGEMEPDEATKLFTAGEVEIPACTSANSTAISAGSTIRASATAMVVGISIGGM